MLTPEEMKALVDAEIAKREAAAVEAVREGRGEALLAYFKWQWFAEKSPLTVSAGVVDVNATMANVGLQRAYLDLVRLVEWAERPAEPQHATHAVSALSGAGVRDG